MSKEKIKERSNWGKNEGEKKGTTLAGEGGSMN